uniref:Uncharacterized protein n=1 Tax=Lactuca sativa TaxID=4236 RepID=A0A9R1UDQ8_LACSA|nr:hypothetical protein LSAT_V11C900460530 [Lactuca sativa]
MNKRQELFLSFHLVGLFSSIIEVLEYIEDVCLNSFSQCQASVSQALQRKDQDIVNAISLVKSTSATLKKMRNDGFNALILDITSFCENNNIQTPNTEEFYVNPRARRQYTNISNRHMQIQEFGDRFNEVSYELLICMTSLNPHDSFCDFDPSKLRKLIDFYPHDFSYKDRLDILHELSVCPTHIQQDGRFAT